MSKKICLITPGHLVTNPRLLKEAAAIDLAGMEIYLIFSRYSAKLALHDERLLAAHPNWHYQCLDWTTATPQGIIRRSMGKLVQKFSKRPEQILNRFFCWQLQKAIEAGADLYIGHNLGTLPVAVQAAKATGAKCGFDAEDYHRNQMSDDGADPHVKMVSAVEDQYLPQLDHLTASSPLIAAAYGGIAGRSVPAILNVFPKLPVFEGTPNFRGKLRLFWFSQTIGPARGIETIIEAIALSKVAVELHLLGAISGGYRQFIQHKIDETQLPDTAIHYHPTVYPDEIFSRAQFFDIGLASEPGFSANNRMALSNKLLTYIQCGLALAVSNTPAQDAFMQCYPQVGMVYDNAAALAAIIHYFDRHRDILFQTRKANFQLGQHELNWEHESMKFTALLKQTLGLI